MWYYWVIGFLLLLAFLHGCPLAKLGKSKKKRSSPTTSNTGAPSLTDEQAACYLRRYPDLQQAFGSDLAKAKSHWASSGFKEGRSYECSSGEDEDEVEED